MSGLLSLFGIAMAVCLGALVVLGLNASRHELREERRRRLSAESDRDDLWRQVNTFLELPPGRRPGEFHCQCCKRMRYLPPEIVAELGLPPDCKGLDL